MQFRIFVCTFKNLCDDHSTQQRRFLVRPNLLRVPDRFQVFALRRVLDGGVSVDGNTGRCDLDPSHLWSLHDRPHRRRCLGKGFLRRDQHDQHMHVRGAVTMFSRAGSRSLQLVTWSCTCMAVVPSGMSQNKFPSCWLEFRSCSSWLDLSFSLWIL